MGRLSKHIDLERDGLAIEAEYLQTDRWAIDAILRAEILTPTVIDPCCGDGRMAMAALHAGANQVIASDLYDWGFKPSKRDVRLYHGVDFLGDFHAPFIGLFDGATVFMNPPFSLACAFVNRAFQLNARKVVCFQRSVWRESKGRRQWWRNNPPNRVYQCGDRADCWYGTIPEENREGGAYQPHSWYVWERGHPPGTIMGSVWKVPQ